MNGFDSGSSRSRNAALNNNNALPPRSVQAQTDVRDTVSSRTRASDMQDATESYNTVTASPSRHQPSALTQSTPDDREQQDQMEARILEFLTANAFESADNVESDNGLELGEDAPMLIAASDQYAYPLRTSQQMNTPYPGSTPTAHNRVSATEESHRSLAPPSSAKEAPAQPRSLVTATRASVSTLNYDSQYRPTRDASLGRRGGSVQGRVSSQTYGFDTEINHSAGVSTVNPSPSRSMPGPDPSLASGYGTSQDAPVYGGNHHDSERRSASTRVSSLAYAADTNLNQFVYGGVNSGSLGQTSGFNFGAPQGSRQPIYRAPIVPATVAAGGLSFGNHSAHPAYPASMVNHAPAAYPPSVAHPPTTTYPLLTAHPSSAMYSASTPYPASMMHAPSTMHQASTMYPPSTMNSASTMRPASTMYPASSMRPASSMYPGSSMYPTSTPYPAAMTNQAPMLYPAPTMYSAPMSQAPQTLSGNHPAASTSAIVLQTGTNPIIPAMVIIHPYAQPARHRNLVQARRIIGYQTDLDNGNSVHERSRLPPCWMSMPDLLCGMPHSTQHPEVILRGLGNGWSYKLMAACQLYARGIVDARAIRRRTNALRHQASAAGRQLFPNVAQFSPSGSPAVGVYDATNYVAPATWAQRMQTRTLSEIGRGWVNFPATEDCGFLTMAVIYARQVGNLTWTTADVPRIARIQGWTLPADATTTQWDQRARDRTIAILRAAGVVL
ncbi:hypothetical protein LTS09_014917 [Friedmanniomyces endolithicus]|nr:hypothetical protein LTS09_014917 [Friedmanniomyces endolithicus]